MDSAHSNNSVKLLSLTQAAERLGVSVETLLLWNEHQILKPTITLQGEIGYTEQQIIQFQAIRGMLNPEISFQIQQDPHVIPAHTASHDSSMQTPARKPEIADFSKSHKIQDDSLDHMKFSPWLVMSGLLVFCIGIVGAAVLKGQDPMFAKKDTNSSETSKIAFSQPVPSQIPGMIQNDSDSQNSHIENASLTTNKAINHDLLYATPTPLPSRNKNTKTVALSSEDIATVAAATDTYSSVSYPSNDSNSIIKGEPNKNVLTALQGVGAMPGVQNQSSSGAQTLLLLPFGALAIFFLLRYKPYYSLLGLTQTGQTTQVAASIPVPISVSSPRILELDQKTDGTVVMYFEGKEYKISKPELYSESDQFISRLMELSSETTKEMEYITAADGKVKLSSPLSRLVTRLGFVGIKRDLFFPRTAKDRVLFRRVITQKDLSDMNVTPTDLLNSLQS